LVRLLILWTINTNPTRPSRHVTWTGGDHRVENYWGESFGRDHRGKSPGEFTCFGLFSVAPRSRTAEQTVRLWENIINIQKLLMVTDQRT